MFLHFTVFRAKKVILLTFEQSSQFLILLTFYHESRFSFSRTRFPNGWNGKGNGNGNHNVIAFCSDEGVAKGIAEALNLLDNLEADGVALIKWKD